MRLSEILAKAKGLLSHSESAPLDAELLLAAVLKTSRAYLLAHAERVLTPEEIHRFQTFVERRRCGEPLAYLLGHKAFWSLDLAVGPQVLVPRPETELIVELMLQLFPEKDLLRRIADLGTGSGAIALSLARERPLWEIYATDLSAAALQLAATNANNQALSQVQFCQGNWCEALPSLSFDAIVSNPPYLTEAEWEANQAELGFEPAMALIGGPDGFADLKKIIYQAKSFLKSGAYLLLEHGSTQGKCVRECLQEGGYENVATKKDLAGLERVSFGQIKYEPSVG